MGNTAILGPSRWIKMLWFKRKRSLVYDPATLRAWESLRVAAAIPVPRFGVPGSSPLLGSAPLPGAPSAGTRSEPGRLRASLRANIAEGMFAEVVTACTGSAVLTAWALHLGAGPMLIGLLGAIPFFAHLVQLPAAWTTATFGARRTALVAVALSRQIWLALVVLPFLPLSPDAKRAVLLVVAALAGIGGVVGNNAWVAWMGDLVPRALRGRYFGRRTALCSLGGSAASLAAGLVLDRTESVSGMTLAVLAAAACGAGAATTWLMSRVHDPTPGVREPLELSAAFAPLSDERARRILHFQGAWNAAVGISSAFYAVHMLTNLGMGFTSVAAHAVLIAGARILAAPLWGRALDRVGARPILIACSFGISLLPLMWLLPTQERWWPLAIEAALSGMLWSGHALAAFTLPLSIAPRVGRAWWLAAFAMTAGVSFAAASSLSGVVAESLPTRILVAGHTMYGLQVLFVASSFARFGAACLAARIVQPDAQPVEELFRFARERVSGSFARVRFF